VHLEDSPLPSTSATMQSVTARILAHTEHDGLRQRAARAERRITRNLVDSPFVNASQILQVHAGDQ
jgi:uncharacterized protein